MGKMKDLTIPENLDEFELTLITTGDDEPEAA